MFLLKKRSNGNICKLNWVKSAWLAIRIFALGKILVGWGQMELRDFFGNARFGRFDVLLSLKLTQNATGNLGPKLTSKGSHFFQMLFFSGALATDITSIFHSVHLATWLCYQKNSSHLPKTKDRKTWQGSGQEFAWWKTGDLDLMVCTSSNQNSFHKSWTS